MSFTQIGTRYTSAESRSAVAVFADENKNTLWAVVDAAKLSSLPESVANADALTGLDYVTEVREVAAGSPRPYDLLEHPRVRSLRAAAQFSTPVVPPLAGRAARKAEKKARRLGRQ